MEQCPENLGAECSLRMKPSWLEGILGCWSEKPPSSLELTRFNKLVAV